jgi:hypothetical protein
MPNPGINRKTAGRPGGALSHYTTDWLNRIAAAGGAKPSQATIRVMNQFGRNLVKANIDSGMVSVCVYVPDNLIASITPYIKTAGYDSYVNTGFVAADLTINGLIGNGTTKFLDTGCIPLSAFPSDASAGIGCYVSNIPAAESRVEGGVQNTATVNSGFEIYANFNGLEEFDCWTFASTAIGALPSNTTSGYMLGTLAAGTNTVYFANAANPHAALGTHAAAGGRIVTFPVFFFATNVSGVATLHTTKRLSVSFLTLSLTAAESSAFFTALDNCRRGLGGGFV